MIKLRFILILLCSLYITPTFSAEGNKTTVVSPGVYKKLQLTDKLIAEKSYARAQQQLQSLLKDVSKNGYEEATVLRSLSSVSALRENYRQAAEYLARCLALKVLPKQQEQQATLNLGELYMADGQHAKAIATLKPWLAQNRNPDAHTHVLLANAYAQLKQFQSALRHIEKALKQTRNPPDSWYQLQLALYYEIKNYRAAAEVLTKLVRIYPDNKDYWIQLVSVYQQTKDYTKAASIKHLAYQKGLLSSGKDLLDLVNLYLYIGSPYKAGKLLNAEINSKRISHSSKHWELLANAWTQAREYDKAIDALKTAAKLSNQGNLYQRIGQIHFAREHWPLAIDAINKAFKRGGIKQPGQAYLILGMSHFELGNKSQARKALLQAAQYSNSRKSANQWLSYIDNN